MQIDNYGAAKRVFDLKGWNLDAFLKAAEEWAESCDGSYGGRSFEYEDDHEMYYFDLVSPAIEKIDVYDHKTGKFINTIVVSANAFPPLDYDSDKYDLDCVEYVEEPVYSLRGFEEPLKLHLTQYAYINYAGDFCGEQQYNYKAHAVDDDGNDYEIVWDVLDDFDPATDEDESWACDWTKFTAYDYYGKEVGNEMTVLLIDPDGTVRE